MLEQELSIAVESPVPDLSPCFSGASTVSEIGRGGIGGYYKLVTTAADEEVALSPQELLFLPPREGRYATVVGWYSFFDDREAACVSYPKFSTHHLLPDRIDLFEVSMQRCLSWSEGGGIYFDEYDDQSWRFQNDAVRFRKPPLAYCYGFAADRDGKKYVVFATIQHGSKAGFWVCSPEYFEGELAYGPDSLIVPRFNPIESPW